MKAAFCVCKIEIKKILQGCDDKINCCETMVVKYLRTDRWCQQVFVWGWAGRNYANVVQGVTVNYGRGSSVAPTENLLSSIVQIQVQPINSLTV